MSNIAIRVENLGKFYKIGEQERYYTFRDRLVRAFMAPFHCVKSRVGRGQLVNRQTGKREDGSFIWALKEVSFEIKQGEVVGVIGRNGAGKSTLLKILSRITEPTEGKAEVFGRVRSLLEVGTGFHPELTGRENIFLNGAIMGMKRAEIRKKFDEIVAFAEVEKFIDTPVKRYSSGMYVRLAFAVAAHLEPEVLLVDEVLAVGDELFQRKCLGKMEDVAGEGRTVVIVSHNMSVVTRLCQRALLLDKGRMVVEDVTTKVVESYLSRHVQGRAQWQRDKVNGSSDFCFISAIARNQRGNVSSIFKADESIEIELVYKVQRSLGNCQVAVQVMNSRGITVFSTSDTDSQNMAAISRQPGVYTTKFVIPGFLLASGRYFFHPGAHLPFREGYDGVEGALVLEIASEGALDSLDARKGLAVVAPLIVWATERQS